MWPPIRQEGRMEADWVVLGLCLAAGLLVAGPGGAIIALFLWLVLIAD